jgi:hypothetical protein
MQKTTPEMKMKLLTMDSWTSTSTTQEGIAQIKTIHDICHKKDGGTNVTTILDIVRKDKDMYIIHQAPNEHKSRYLLKFKGVVNVVKLSGGSLWFHPAATKIV